MKTHAVTMFNNVLYIKSNVLSQIYGTIGKTEPETGGIVGGIDNVISEFYFDSTAECNKNTYIPNLICINKAIREWANHSMEFMGFIHSHSKGNDKLSAEDLMYAKQLLAKTEGLEKMYLLILAENEKVIVNLKAYAVQL